MLWRLNFLVLFCCLALNNRYMLYYICPMHTLFTVMVYVGEFCKSTRRRGFAAWFHSHAFWNFKDIYGGQEAEEHCATETAL